MANAVNNIFGKLKTKFSGLSPQNLLEQSELNASLDDNKTIKISNPKSERYTYLPNVTGSKFLKNFKPQSKEEKDTLSPTGFFRVGEIDEQKNKKIPPQLLYTDRTYGRDRYIGHAHKSGGSHGVQTYPQCAYNYSQNPDQTVGTGIE